MTNTNDFLPEGFCLVKGEKYMVNKKGDVYSLISKKFLFPSKNKNGYLTICFKKSTEKFKKYCQQV